VLDVLLNQDERHRGGEIHAQSPGLPPKAVSSQSPPVARYVLDKGTLETERERAWGSAAHLTNDQINVEPRRWT